MLGEPLEHALRGQPIPVADALERLRNRRFDSTLTQRVHSGAAFRETEYGASSITGMVGTGQEALSDQTVEHSGERARMHVQLRFEMRSSPCTTAHSSCMNCSTSGRRATSPVPGLESMAGDILF
jgi:hypothetical protein